MGLDGFSMANLGLHKEFTSAQLASNAEALAKRGTEHSIKNIDGMDQKQKIERKNSDDESEGFEFSYYDDEEEESTAEDENTDQQASQRQQKKYNVKLNNDSQMIELIDTENNSIIETISPSDLIKLVSKLNSASGILINRKI